MQAPVICFGQQPCGFFPKRFLVAKIRTARRLQQQLGGRLVFFYHDSDADYRETITLLRDRQTDAEVRLNFIQENKLQKKFSPLYLKRIPQGWQEETRKQLPRFMDQPLIDLFDSVAATNVADFCLEMYEKLGLLEGIATVRSGDPAFRQAAADLGEGYFADVPYQNEIVRAQLLDGRLKLHEGGGKYLTLPDQPLAKQQKNPGRETRFYWMQSVIGCTHYIYGEGEKAYLRTADFPGVEFVDREKIEQADYAWLDQKL
ncbi:MAG TPA: hypothetical protein VHA30_04115 [Patescibacteria group bacterium]|nr:hypothetical protein [Patescibacteria group bacterium]